MTGIVREVKGQLRGQQFPALFQGNTIVAVTDDPFARLDPSFATCSCSTTMMSAILVTGPTGRPETLAHLTIWGRIHEVTVGSR